ncbi:MAG: exosome protein [Nitrosopumilales archaeon CG_4_10_14_0_8_um_filter_34_8]|nr:MAG: exosome protein [Nitrosopumilales archaeon CG_4_10_14_0_8_um_filter_34_8]PJB98676.1 MAG: exosome protein [Nitrosopumilales archaeon CG_4_9_14_0_8_um_filter_34_10]
MVDKLEVTIDVIIHATEDISKFLKSFEDIFELNDSFTVNETLGYYENSITILSRKIDKKQAQKFVGKLIELLPKDQISKLIEEIEERTVDSRLHIRLDKQEFVNGNIVLSDRDAIKVKIYTPIYNKKDTVKIFSEIFQNAN